MSDIAVIKTGGKQYKVVVGDKIKVEKIESDPSADGKNLELDDLLNGKKVAAEIISEGKRDKIVVFKQHPKKRYSRTNGHRQNYTEIKITGIN
ncbi:TPA: 50S ribosomal protein L21 [Candidatus Berkelbacteria bacterium]|uniref:Large ribosomal subunit protein bL21 n=1 Tax=Berkelbacteria bacterium GW2011_GWE1_39_12 TaxID=1618337 RepID=A0A0G4B387_9BACT|nr:MAG: 50S ribosomal protein L21, large subunit ribosomal protein L21 [Berkelbacteria bacterium GW2011_GWE1_39_12]HBO60455.1 50S ribosomal protein L21 [Candidatus Berkelbacteria bacterium]